jgi:hypothetical protein
VTRPDFLAPSFEVVLTKLGAIKEGKCDREWFEESLRLSRDFVELGKALSDMELERILTGEV